MTQIGLHACYLALVNWHHSITVRFCMPIFCEPIFNEASGKPTIGWWVTWCGMRTGSGSVPGTTSDHGLFCRFGVYDKFPSNWFSRSQDWLEPFQNDIASMREKSCNPLALKGCPALLITGIAVVIIVIILFVMNPCSTLRAPAPQDWACQAMHLVGELWSREALQKPSPMLSFGKKQRSRETNHRHGACALVGWHGVSPCLASKATWGSHALRESPDPSSSS